MHIAQFTEGQFVRHSSYGPGEYATVLTNDAAQQNDVMVGSVTIKPSHPLHGETFTVSPTDNEEAPGAWEDSEWALVGPQWFRSHEMEVPAEVAEAFPDEDDQPDDAEA